LTYTRHYTGKRTDTKTESKINKDALDVSRKREKIQEIHNCRIFDENEMF
jgi:hypothetical protein